jgi:hypothetical protein
MLRALLMRFVVSIWSCSLRADFALGKLNDAYPRIAVLTRGSADNYSSLQIPPKGHVTLDERMTILIFEDLDFSFRGTYTEP